MKTVLPPPAGAKEEISALTELLRKTGQRLEELTAGEVDSVVDHTGRLFLLKGVPAQLRRAEDSRQAAILNALPAHIALLDAQGLIISVNEAWRQFASANALHYPGHAVGVNYLDICDRAQGDHAAEARQAADGIRSVMSGQTESFSLEYPCHSPGDLRWFLLTATPLAGNPPNGAVVMHLNITERKRAEEEERAASQLLDNIVANIPTAVQLKEVQDDFRIQMWNKAAETMYGLPSSEAVGRSVHDLWPKADADLMHAADLQLVATGTMQDFPDRIAKTKTRGDIHVHMRKVALLDPGGKATHVLVVADDITARMESEARINRDAEALRRFASAMDATADAIYLVDRSSMQFIHVNEAACRMQSLSREELLALGPAGLLGVARAELERTYDAIIASGKDAEPLEMRRQRADGSEVWVELRRHSLRSGDSWTMVTLVRDVTEQKQAALDLSASEARFRSLTLLSSDWFWEQDEEHRFVAFSGGEGVKGWGPDQQKAVGLHRWDLGGVVPISYSWEVHKELLDAHEPFRNFEYRRILGDGRLQHVEASGEPVFAADGRFTGYRGVATDITERKRTEQDLKRFRMAMEISGDAIVLVDRSSMRYIDVNQALCEMVGRTRQELIGMTPMELMGKDRAELEREYDAIIADNNSKASNIEGRYRRLDGTSFPIEAHRRAMHTGNDWIIVSTARDVTERKKAEAKVGRLNRVLAMLSGINALILRVHDRNQLFAEACRLAKTEGGFMLARIVDLDAGGAARIAATTESDPSLFQRMLDDHNRDPVHSPSVISRVLRSKQSLISNDVANDPQIPDRAKLTKEENYALALLPIMMADKLAGVLILRARETGRFDESELGLLHELTGNLSFALEQIAMEHKLARTTRVNAMLSGINGAILHIRDRQALLEEACSIAVRTGGLPSAWIGLVDEDQLQLRLAASAGTVDGLVELIHDRLSLRDDAPLGHSASARSVREKRAMVVDDVASGQDVLHKKAHTDRGIKSIASLPLIVANRAIGVLVLHAADAGFFDEEEMRLVKEVAENISFALKHMEEEAKVKRLTRVYAVLSGINTLIVRARNHDELLKEACNIAVEQGRFKLAWIGMIDRSEMKLTPVASAGATADPLLLVNQSFSLLDEAPPGNALSARAIREGKVSVSNDVQNDPKVLFKEEHEQRGSRSMAMLPLRIENEVVGMLALYSGEVGFFDSEELKLLTELAGDIAFAIDHLGKQARLDYLSYYDALTGLANRTLFLERVGQYTRSASTGAYRLALFLVDLERFKNINDSLGRPAGDALLKQVAEWLTLKSGDASLVARLGADHFAIVLPEVKKDGNVEHLLTGTIAAFMEHPFRLDDAVFRIALKAGIAFFPEDGADADTLLRNAEAALKKAKWRGDRFLFYKQKMNATAAGKLTLENQLRQALEKNEFVLHYQPKVTLAGGKLTGAEALIRWNDPKTGLVPPGRFIPVLEETGLIYEVGRWALRQTIGDYLRWRNAGLPAVRMAVNVSPLQLRDRGFATEIEKILSIDSQAPAGLELEITESLIMEDVNHSIAMLKAIRASGVTIAIDDFGTGFSSLSYLAKLPVDILKIDRSFVVDMTAGPEGLALVSTIVNLAHSLSLKVVAEGVETEEQSRLLRLLRCDEFQGFLFSKPVPADIFESRFLAAQNAPSPIEVT